MTTKITIGGSSFNRVCHITVQNYLALNCKSLVLAMVKMPLNVIQWGKVVYIRENKYGRIWYCVYATDDTSTF